MPIIDRAQLSEKLCQLSAYSLRMVDLRKEGGQISEALSKAIYQCLGCK